MNCRKMVVISFLIVGVLVTSMGCGSFSFKKPVKAPVSKIVTPTSPIEWQERKWEQYGEDKNGTVYFFERESVMYPAKGIIHVWRKRQLSGSTKGLKEITSFDEIDCRTDKFRSLELQGVNYDDTKTVIFKKPSMWSTIFQDSADEYITNQFCKDALKGEVQPKK